MLAGPVDDAPPENAPEEHEPPSPQAGGAGPSRRAARIRSALVILAVCALGAGTLWDLPLRTSVTDFMPDSDDAELAEVAREVTDSEVARTTILSIGPTDDPHLAASLAARAGELLREEPGIAWVRTGPPEGVQTAFYDLYFARRFAFGALDREEASAITSDAGLEARVTSLRDELAGPMAMLIRRVAPEDPLLFFPSIIRAIQSGGGASEGEESASRLDVVDDHFVTHEEDGERTRHFGVVMLASRGTTFRAEVQEPILAAIEGAFTRARDEAGPAAREVRLEQAGVARFAVRTERALRDDTERISTLSTIAIALIFLVLFRGPRFLVIGTIPMVVGTLASIIVCRVVFDGIHAITLAFGSSLLGVGIDFVSHYVNQQTLEPKETPEATIRAIQPALVLGALTTLAGLAGLAFSSFPGMREMALFATVGVGASLAATLWLVPPWMPEHPRPTRAHLALARSQGWLFERLRANPVAASALPALAVVACVVGLPRVHFVDDLRRLNEIDHALVEEDMRVRGRISQGEAGRFVMAIGDDDEAALQANDRATRALRAAREAGELGRFRSISPFLRARGSQEAVDGAIRGDATLPDRLRVVLEREGFVADLFTPFRDALAAPAPEPLTHDALAASALGSLVEPFRIELADPGASEGSRVAYLTFLEGVPDPSALAARLADVEGVRYFDQARYLESAYRLFRERAVFLVAFGLLGVFAMCYARYRDLLLSAAALAPATLATLTSLACVGLFGEEANLMHLLACLLVLSMGEDYAVFLIEERHSDALPTTTMTGILLACVTTVLSFGLLAMSAHPALRALGLVTSLGVGLALVFSPLSLVLVRIVERRRARE